MSGTLSNALLLTAPPAAGALDDAAIALARPFLGGRQVIQEWWKGAGEAWEALFLAGAGEDLGPLRAGIAAALAPRPIDVNIIADDIALRRKKLLVADMESTIIEQECLDELADYVGLRPRIAAITERAMRGELDFEAALKERVGLLGGLDVRVLDELYANRITLMPGARTLVATMRKNGAICALVSGGFTFFTERVAARVGFDVQQANTLQIAGGKLAGTVAEPILGREAKLAALERLTREHRLAPAETIAVGDGANDLTMIKAAGLGVAFRAKPVVAAAAAASITHGDLTALLYLQGYRREEFTEL
ncbi:MAG: phosphoserine phosphatase SerB [Hyphomicrobiaceae bacterium]|nr:MAG: phosphoserine phosphatase SerB [Hyphomicrobiaceae bacterium]